MHLPFDILTEKAKYTILALLFLKVTSTFSQNLVSNPGFDSLTACPSGQGQVDLAAPWTSAWLTPDLFHVCASDDDYTLPQGGVGVYSHYQPSRSGQGYAGLYSYWETSMLTEFIQAPLLSRLIKGTSYLVEFYVVPDLNPEKDWVYTDAIGLSFMEGAYDEEVIPDAASVLNPAIENIGILITDTMNWTRISGCYLADGTESYLIIGNFRNEMETMIDVENPNIWPHVNYFFIEDVLVEAFDPLPDTLILCEDTSAQFNAAFHDASYFWNTGETDSVLDIQQPGLYIVEAEMNGCVLRDSCLVLDGSVPTYFPLDTIACTDQAILLSSPLPGTYLWSDGSSLPQLTITNPGIYSLSVDNDCGHFGFSTAVSLEECTCTVTVPNVFSPNGDGINDRVEASINCEFEYKILSFQIFDRWGTLVFEDKGMDSDSWDGRKQGNECQSGVYVWSIIFDVLQYTVPERQVLTGDITLIR